jgi:hypothetical protein
VWTVRDAATHDPHGDFNGRETCAPPRCANGVVRDVAEDVDGAVYSQDGEDGAAWVLELVHIARSSLDILTRNLARTK